VSFGYNGYAVADIEVTGVFGRAGVGASLLCLCIAFHVPQTALAEVRLRNFQLRINVVGSDGQVPVFLGFAEPEVPLELATKSGQNPRRLIFELPLAEGQLFALEKFRGGDDLHLKLRFTALADGPNGVWPQQDEVSHRLNLSDWSKVLKELQGPEYMVIGIPLPKCAQNHTLTEAVGRIRRAHAHLVDGRFDAVVSECRLAIESAGLATGEQTAISAAAKKMNSTKREMTKLEREFALMEAVRHYTQLAHHVDDYGAAEYYSRDDANMLLATATALIASSLARLQSSEVHGLGAAKV
jgi:hypothetical protein